MTILEFLDRALERRVQNPNPPKDIRQFIGFAFLAGYYLFVYRLAFHAVPPSSAEFVKDALLTLGPPIGIIIGAMFRGSAREDQQAVNTQEALRTIKAVAGTGNGSGADKPDITLDPGQTTTIAAEEPTDPQ
jgi:hypothetical protein